MTKLRFYAKGAALVRQPDVIEIIGQAPHFVGRARAQLSDGRFAYPAVEAAFEVDSNTSGGRRLCKLTSRDGALWPADAATAKACQVAFIPVEYADGEWVPSAPLTKSTSSLKKVAS